MNSEAVITELVQSVIVKREKSQTAEDRGTEHEEVMNGLGIKQEIFDQEDISADFTCYNKSDIKTEENYNLLIYDDRMSSSGEEMYTSERTTHLPATINDGTQDSAGAENSLNYDYLEGHTASLQSRRISHLKNDQEIQNSLHNEDQLCECDMCGSFLPESELRTIKNKSTGSANVCPKCRNLAARKRKLLKAKDVVIPNTSSPTCKHPCCEKWPGVYNFSFQVVAIRNRNAYQYSTMLNKLYTHMNSPISIQFNCKWGDPDLYVRAVPVYLNEVIEPVIRCTHHMRPSEETNVDFPFAAHVIRCDQDMCSYEVDKRSGRLSVLAPLGIPPPGSDSITIMYRFMCSISCLGGMNRRPIQVIFTLERHKTEIVGREILQVRVCSCPQRDMTKDEYRLNFNRENTRKCEKNISEVLEACKLCKKPKYAFEDSVTYIPVCGDRSLVKKALLLLRSNLIGGKLAAGEELTKNDEMNWKIFNQLLSDDAGPSGR